MSIQNKIAQYREYKSGVSHCTFNPVGPGVVRIHLVPPKFRFFRSSSYIVILNGYYLLPLGYSWALILSNFMKEVNQFDSKPITEDDEDQIVERTVRNVHKVYPTVPKQDIEEDLEDLLDVLFAALLIIAEVYIVDSYVSYNRGRGFLSGHGYYVHTYGRSNPHYIRARNKYNATHSGGRRGGGSGCACACACACAGGGRAGCSQKDTYAIANRWRK